MREIRLRLHANEETQYMGGDVSLRLKAIYTIILKVSIRISIYPLLSMS
ncbi:MAG: hypothetical protein LBF12_01020 [Christensenellaceae bacterium]|jgi:hypothetical protein|nr:hypothetical protein [Christensenellaceae bacterium]